MVIGEGIMLYQVAPVPFIATGRGGRHACRDPRAPHQAPEAETVRSN